MPPFPPGGCTPAGFDPLRWKKDPRGDHDRQFAKDNSRNLIAEGLAPARQHYDQGVLFLQDMGNSLFLKGPERFKAEDFFQDGLRTIHGETL